MKKMMVLMLMVMMLACTACGAMASTEIEFTPTKLNAVGLSADEWMTSVESRALLVTLGGFELEQLEIGFDSACIMREKMLSGVLSGMLQIAYDTGEGDVYYVIYNPRRGYAVCEVMEDCDANIMEHVFDYMGADCFESRREDLMYVVCNFEDVLRRLMRY